jgi:hypothetical protein
MLKRVIGIGTVGLVLLATGACSDDDNGGGSAAGGSAGSGGGSGAGGGAGTAGGNGGIPLGDVPAKYAAASCVALAACFGELAQEFMNGEDCNQLLEKRIANGDFASLQQAVASGKVTYDGTKMQACLDRLSGAGCKLFTEREFAECVAASDGTIAEGGDCNFDFECKSPAFCKVDAACPGKCAPLQAAGAACTDDDQCQSGLICTGPGTCEKPSAAGQSCQNASATPCEPGLLCFGGDPQAGTPGTCKTIAELFSADLGATCNLADGPYCKPGLSCAVESVSATEIVTKCVAAGTSACTISYPDMCPTGQYCKHPDQDFNGTCTPLPGDGQPCVSDTCVAYTRCESGTCRSLQDNGGTCQENDTCYSEACVAGKCAADTPCN